MPNAEKPSSRGDRSHRRRGVFRRLRRWWQALWFSRLFRWLLERIEDWWYPAPEQTADHQAYSRSSRQNRIKWLWRRLRRTTRSSFVGKATRSAKSRWYDWWYDWWYPVADEPGTNPSGGYRRRSRLARAWSRTKRFFGNSWMASSYRAASFGLHDWWFPVVEDPRSGQISSRRLSRPVRFVRHCNRWLRRTWLGRKFGWLLDELDAVLFGVGKWFSWLFTWRRIKSWLWRWETAVVFVGLVLAAVGWHQYGLPRYRVYREEKYAEQAQQYFTRGDFARALLRARQVLLMNQNNAAAVRVLAELADRFGSPQAIYWRQRQVTLNPDTTNRLALAKTALRVEAFPFPAANKALTEVAPAAKQTSSYHLVAGALEIKRNNLALAEQHYAEAYRLNPDEPANRYSLAVLQLQSSNPRLISDSRTTLELLQTDRQLGLMATRTLMSESISRREWAQAEGLSRRVLTNAQVSFSDRVVHLAILNAQKSGEFTPFLKETQKHAEENWFYVGELASWLSRQGFARENLEWTGGLPDRLTKQGMVPLAIADSYVNLERWKELAEYLKEGPWGDFEPVRFAMMVLAHSKQNADRRDALLWQQTFGLASGSPAMLNVLARLAASWHWKEETEAVLWHAQERFPNQEWPLQSLKEWYAGLADTVGLRRVFRAFLDKDPTNLWARNNFAQLSMLLGQDLEKAQEFAAEVHAAEPENAEYTSTYAFSLYRQGRAREAVETIRKIGLNKLDEPAMAAYYAVFLSAAGEVQAARAYLGKSEKAVLLPEELALVERAKKAM